MLKSRFVIIQNLSPQCILLANNIQVSWFYRRLLIPINVNPIGRNHESNGIS